MLNAFKSNIAVIHEEFQFLDELQWSDLINGWLISDANFFKNF